MADKTKEVSNETSKLLLQNVNDYAAFVGQVLHDETFLTNLKQILPFDKLVGATKNLVNNGLGIKKMGIAVMRMDIDQPLYSLAVTLCYRGADGEWQNESIFINACKTIDELQQLATDDNFRREVVSLCEERVCDENGKPVFKQ